MKEANFKETDIGKIPVDWEVKTLGELTDRIGDGIHSTPNYSKDGGYFFINGNNLISGNIKIFEDTKTVNLEEYKIHKRDLSEKTILLSINGTIGNIAIFNNEKVILGKSACYINLKSIKNLQFIYYILQSNLIQKYFFDNLTGSTIKNLGLGTISNTQIPLPPLAEQKKIAKALSDTDLWIESTEAFLAKKRLLKKGAMQKLLSPKEDWEVKSIIGIVNNDRKLFNDGDWVESVHIKSDEIRLLQTGNIGIGKFLNKASKKYISEESFKQLNCKEVFENDVLICRLAEPAGRCCLMTKIDEKKLIVSVDVSIFRPDENLYDRRFLVYTMCTDEWFNNVIEKVGGTTHKRISRSNLGEIKFSLPPLKTQQEIAEILSSMDLEIESLENRLQKARNIKQGMMQDLLTGKVRLG